MLTFCLVVAFLMFAQLVLKCLIDCLDQAINDRYVESAVIGLLSIPVVGLASGMIACIIKINQN